MADPAKTVDQNILPVQALFNLDNSFNTFIGQGLPFFATVNPSQSGLAITNSTIDSSTIGATTPSTGVFTNVLTTTGQVTTSPSGNTDIANKFYVDSVAQGLGPKAACDVATTANITLSGLQTIDAYTTLAGDRVLVKNQSTSSQNGIYIAAAGAWTRSSDMDVWSEVPGAYTVILNGSANIDTAWVCTASKTGTIGVTAMPWVIFSSTAAYTAGTGLTLAANQFSITNTGVTAASYGSASKTLVATVNAQGQLTALSASDIAIAASQITSGILAGTYGGTGVNNGANTLTWNASYTLNQSVASGAAPNFLGTNFSSIPNGALTNSSITVNSTSIALGGSATITAVNPFALTIGSGLTGTSYNGSAAVTITNSAPMVYPGSGIPNSTGSAWGTSYSTTGSGTVVALATAASLSNPTISNYEDWTSSSAPSYAESRIWYDSTQKALTYYNDVTNNALHLGQETQLKVYNNTGSTITKGSPVYITSTSSGFTYPLVALAKADNQTTGAAIGLVNQDIPTASAGYVVISGIVNGVNTGTFTVGDTLYVSPYSAGQLMNTYPPTGYAVKIGVVAYSNSPNGNIYVSQSNAYVVSGGIIGQVAITNGGTNGTATPTSGAVAYGTGTAYGFTAAGTSGQVLTSAGSGVPTWTTPTAYATVTDDTTTNATRYPLFAAATSGNLTTEYTSSTKYQFNPSTGVLTATSFSGAGTGLTGTASSLSIGGNAANVTGTVAVGNGGTGVATLSGLAYGNGTSAFTAATAAQVVAVINSTAVTNATNAVNTGTTDDTSTNATVYPVWKTNTTGNLPEKTSSTKLKFNPSTGALTVSQLIIAP
jgi:hypothetical protein